MNDITLRVVTSFPEPAFSRLSEEVFADYEASRLLADALNEEASARAKFTVPETDALRIGAFREETLVGWTYARRDGPRLLMVNSGVSPSERRRGLYSSLVQAVVEHAKTQGYVSISSRHAVSNNRVIIAKLKLGFFVSGFEYSETYGPLVLLAYLLGERRRALHQARTKPLRPPNATNDA